MLVHKLWHGGAAYCGAWNFGPRDDDAKPVTWIADFLTKAWGSSAGWVQDGDIHPHEAHHLKLDCTKAKMQLDWQPRWRLEEALDAIIDWHRAFRNKQDMREFTLSQISRYLAHEMAA
jgi:CDP-glucose 4,6-dehydratase